MKLIDWAKLFFVLGISGIGIGWVKNSAFILIVGIGLLALGSIALIIDFLRQSATSDEDELPLEQMTEKYFITPKEGGLPFTSEELLLAKQKCINAFSKENPERMISCMCGRHQTTFREMIEDVNLENDEGRRWINNMASLRRIKLKMKAKV